MEISKQQLKEKYIPREYYDRIFTEKQALENKLFEIAKDLRESNRQTAGEALKLMEKMEKIISYIAETTEAHKTNGFGMPTCLKEIEKIINE
jgi:hypothetical protein